MPKDHQMIQAFVLLCLIQINEGFAGRNYAARAQRYSCNGAGAAHSVRLQMTG
jgi:hypothetical protein